MKKVLLLGDSIRMGYDEYVKELLQGECEVYYSEDNGRFAAYTLWQVNQMYKQHGHFDLVHWNNGYWDMNIEAPMTEPMLSLEEYLHFLRRIAHTLKGWGAKIIFATTTPIWKPGHAADISTGATFRYDNEWVTTYNAAAKLLMAEEEIPVNDLYALCLEDERYYKCPDMLHLTEEGYRRCARQISDCIRRHLD